MQHRLPYRSIRIAISGTILLTICAVASFADFGDPDALPPPIASGTVAPPFTSKTIAGQPLSLSSLRGHVTVLDFWATWCGSCKMVMPSIQKIYTDYHSKGVDVVGVSLDTDTVSKVAPTVKSLGVTYPVTADPQRNTKTGRDYNADSLPCIYIVDKHGIVRWSYSGVSATQDHDIRAQLDRLLKQK